MKINYIIYILHYNNFGLILAHSATSTWSHRRKSTLPNPSSLEHSQWQTVRPSSLKFFMEAVLVVLYDSLLSKAQRYCQAFREKLH